MKGILMLIFTLFLMSLFGCFYKKEEKTTLASWLNEQEPGKYIVTDKLINLDPKNLYNKKSTAVLALASNPEVQIKIEYHKDRPDLGLHYSDVQETFVSAQSDMQIAHDIHANLIKQDSNKISVGVITPAIYFLVYGDPTIDVRKTTLKNVLSVLEARNDQERNRIWIEIMEDSVYGKEFKEVVPNGYWFRQDNSHEDHKLLSLEFDWQPGISFDSLMDHWQVNLVARRSADYLADAYQQALMWAEKNVRTPFYLEGEQAIHYEIDGVDLMAIRYSFPYFKEKIDPSDPMFETKVQGYVTGIYQVDEKKYKGIKSVVER